MPAGVVNGDLLIAFIITRNSFGATPAGWTEVGPEVGGFQGAGSRVIYAKFWWKYKEAGDPTQWNFTYASGVGAIGGIVAYSGVHNTAPISNYAALGTAENSANLVAPSVDIGSNRALVGLFLGRLDSGNATPSVPAGMTERLVDAGNSFAESFYGLRVADEFPASGATGTRTGVMAGGAGTGVGALIAISGQEVRPSGIQSSEAWGTPFVDDLPVASGVLADLRADFIQGLSAGSAVASWPDARRNADWAQGTAGARPTYRVNVAGGQPAVDFDGVDDLLVRSTEMAPVDTTVFVVIRPHFDINNANERGLLGRSSLADPKGGIGFGPVTGTIADEVVYFFAVDGGTVAGAAHVSASRSWPADRPRLVAFRLTGQVESIRFNGVELTLTETSGGTLDSATNKRFINVDALGRSFANYFDGDVLRVVVYDRALTDPERASVEKYLNNLYDVPVAEPAGIPSAEQWGQPRVSDAPASSGLILHLRASDSGFRARDSFDREAALQTVAAESGHLWEVWAGGFTATGGKARSSASQTSRATLDPLRLESAVTNGDFESTIAPWVNGGSNTLTQQALNPRSGTGHARSVSTAAANAFTVNGTGSSGFPVLPSTVYRFVMEYLPLTVARQFQVNIRWYDSGGSQISLVGGASIAPGSQTAGVYNLYSHSFGTSPANAAFARVDIFFTAGGAGEAYYYDNISLTPVSSTQGFTIEVDLPAIAQNRYAILRHQDESNYIYAGLNSSNQLVLRKCVAGVHTTVATAAGTFTAGGRLKAEYVTTSYRISLDNVVGIDWTTVTDFASHYRAGLYVDSPTAAVDFENFTIKPGPGALVRDMVDLSTSQNDLQQLSYAARPALAQAASVLNDKLALSADGIDDWLKLTSALSPADITVIAVMQFKSAIVAGAADKRLIGREVSTNPRGLITFGDVSGLFTDETVSMVGLDAAGTVYGAYATAPFGAGRQSTMVFRLAGAIETIRRDASAMTVTDGTGGGLDSSLDRRLMNLDALFRSGGTFGDFYVTEFFVWNRALSDAEIITAENLLIEKYATGNRLVFKGKAQSKGFFHPTTLFKVSGTGSVEVTSTGELFKVTPMDEWTWDESQKAWVQVFARASMRVITPVVPAPNGEVWLKRVSVVYPTPTYDENMTPVDWTPTSRTEFDWGRPRLLVGGVDVTFFRGVPSVIESWSSVEPYDDEMAFISFPQIGPFEDYLHPVTGIPWLREFADVRIERVDSTGATVNLLFEGLVPAFRHWSSSRQSGLQLQCVGTLFQADWYVVPPPFRDEVRDIGEWVADFWQEKYDYAAFRGGPPIRGLTGIQSRWNGGWDSGLAVFDELLGKAMTDIDQWTIGTNRDNPLTRTRPEMRLKNRVDIHHTFHVGQPGIEVDLVQDFASGVNVIYGEGEVDGCYWRNTQYPNLRPDDAPVFPGTLMSPGHTGSDWHTFVQEGIKNGWGYEGGFGDDSTYNADEENTVRHFQITAGLQVDGIVGPQTWAAMFEVGSNGGDLAAAFFAPLIQNSVVEPFARTGSGAILGPNPEYDRNHVRVERHVNYGSRVSKGEGFRAAQQEIWRNEVPGYVGTITCSIDSDLVSRYEMRAGQNVLLRGFRGYDKKLHVVRAEVDPNAGTATLTVDEKFRDQMTVVGIMQRDRETHDPVRRARPVRRSSKAVEDRAVTWDCESGAGIIPYHATYAGLWNVLRIPAAERGQVVSTEFQTDLPAEFAVAIFDRPTSHVELRRLIPNPLDSAAWAAIPEDSGLLINWGGEDAPAGYSPGHKQDDSVLTGKLIDDMVWSYESLYAPWLWVAVWVQSPSINHISGHLKPGLDGT